MANQVIPVEVGFEITDHPALGARQEDILDLETAWVTDILQGAWMGNAILRFPEADFSTPPGRNGWRGLVEWCLRLDSTIEALRSGAASHRMSIPDGSDEIIFQRTLDRVVVSCNYASIVATVETVAFVEAAADFIRSTILWINSDYPAAKKNAQAQQHWRRLDRFV